LGTTGLRVSAICFGTWAFGGEWGPVDEDEAKATIGHALEIGINFFDTAQGYGFGRSEGLLADALWDRVRREDVVVATKGGLRRAGDRIVRDASASWLRQGVAASLQNLRTDYIDLYQVHWPDPATPAEETGAALADLVGEGKVRHVGVSNYGVADLEALRSYVPVATLQPPYHLFRRDIEADILPYCAGKSIGVLVYGTLAHGLLAGAMTPRTTFASDDWRSHSSDFSGERFVRNLAVVDELREFATQRGISLVELAVAWTLSNPAVDVAHRRGPPSRPPGRKRRRRRSEVERRGPGRDRPDHGSSRPRPRADARRDVVHCGDPARVHQP
jgi:aryl-alcohol dehydrogenase-like predicted oxidoreductase